MNFAHFYKFEYLRALHLSFTQNGKIESNFILLIKKEIIYVQGHMNRLITILFTDVLV